MEMVVNYLNFAFHIETKTKYKYKTFNLAFLNLLKTRNGTLGTQILIISITKYFPMVFYHETHSTKENEIKWKERQFILFT